MSFYELDYVNRLVPKMTARNISLGQGFIQDNKFIIQVTGYNLTTAQIIELDQNGELTNSGVTEYAKSHPRSC